MPNSPYMLPKQTEMDGIVETIYSAIETNEHLQSTLLVLCGDHGMNDAGNHGGSAEGETSPALVFLSPKLQTISKGLDCPLAPAESSFNYYSIVEQSDIAPTLAGLIGFPMPLNNLGVFIPHFLDFWNEGYLYIPTCLAHQSVLKLIVTTDMKIHLMLQNARQILDIVRETFPGLSFDEGKIETDCTKKRSDGENLSCLWATATSVLNHHAEVNAVTALRALTRVGDRINVHRVKC